MDNNLSKDKDYIRKDIFNNIIILDTKKSYLRTNIIYYRTSEHTGSLVTLLNVQYFCLHYALLIYPERHICVKVFKNGPSKICGRQPLNNLK